MLVDALCLALGAYGLILFAAILVSLATSFGWRPPPPLWPALGVLRSVTEPVLGAVRRYLPPVGGLDFSPILIFIGINIARRALGC